MSAQTAATRLRRTFAYPSESDDEDAVEAGMDEQDQAELVQKLGTHDMSTTSTYTHLFLVLPLLPIPLYIPLLFRLSDFLPALAAVASLLASAYALYFLPLAPVKISITSVEDLKTGRRRTQQHDTKAERRPVPYITQPTADFLEKYTVLANGFLCVVLAVVELSHRRTWGEGMTVGGGFLPGLVMTVVMFARRELRTVDMTELERLRYNTGSTR